MKYHFTVPPTNEQGSHSGICSASYTETYRQNALWDYNSARAHDGLPPLDRMPKGTRYEAIPEPRKWAIEYIVQGHYGSGYGWEDENTEETYREGKRSLREYRENGPGAYRLIKRRVLNPAFAAPATA